MAGTRIGFIGLGALGGAIATRLQEAGHGLHLWGRSKDKLAPWIKAGAIATTTPAAQKAAVAAAGYSFVKLVGKQRCSI